jgi:hypothetical protein
MRRHKSCGGRGKALDLWEAPAGAGEPLLCLATTFTFDATFFETECLGRFLQMETHPQETEAVGYLIEREEKLAATQVAVLVDRRHAGDKQSLRWDVLPVVARGAVQHAKVAILCWAEHVRLLVGSANLTATAYRKNVEVLGAIDLSSRQGGPREHVLAAVDFLGQLLDEVPGDEARSGPKQRVRRALTTLGQHIQDWPGARPSPLTPVPVFGGPGRAVFKQLGELWPAGGPPRSAHVLSPFFDAEAGAGATIAGLNELLAKRGPREVYFYVPWENLPDGRMRVFAPRSLIEAARGSCDTFVSGVSLNQDSEPRPLHAKMLVLANDDWEMWLLGSSNFTRAGFGVPGSAPNREANLVYRVKMDSAEHRQRWSVRSVEGQTLLDSDRWDGQPKEHRVDWTAPSPPFVLSVHWESAGQPFGALWAVNLVEPTSLPPPDALRDLSLEEFIEILGSTRPLHEIVPRVLTRRGRKPKDEVILDPHKRVNTETFLLRRARRIAGLLERLRERLERPVLSVEALEWRLSGPVGPQALAAAIRKDTRSPEEACFFLAELALALKRVRAAEPARGGLAVEVIQDRLRACIHDIGQTAASFRRPGSAVDRYVEAAFEEAGR